MLEVYILKQENNADMLMIPFKIRITTPSKLWIENEVG